MNILFLTQYFPPEVGAPQNRLYELAVRLRQKGMNISILTAMPNYPKMVVQENYKGRFYCNEKMNNLTVHRCYIFVKRSNSIIIRLLNYFSFVFSSAVIGAFKVKKFEYIFCESPPLFIGISALFLCRIKKARLIFNVSDLWPESAEKLGLVRNRFLLTITRTLEEYLYKKACLITCQTNGIKANILRRFHDKKVYWLKNGVDVEFFKDDGLNGRWRKNNFFSMNDFLVFYGGIFGHAQGLEIIIYAAQILKDRQKIKFVLIGDGPEKEKLKKLKNELNLDNVLLFDPVSREQMPEIISSIDLGIIPLRNIELFKGAIPSKIFELLASKKPILLGVEGEAYDLFIKDGRCGLSYKPEDAKDLADKIIQMQESPSLAKGFGEQGYVYVKENFNRDNIANEFSYVLDNLSCS